MQRFENRREAGRELAALLREYAGRDDVTVLALPRGGVPVAYEVARALGAPLDVFVVRKLGVPGQRELAFGAIAVGGARVLNQELVEELGIDEACIQKVVAAECKELHRREQIYRGDWPPLEVTGRTVVLIDDGLATGATMRAAVVALKQFHPAEVVVAVPVGSADTCEELDSRIDRLVCAHTPDPFLAVGCWYEDFLPTSDQEVTRLLQQSRREQQE